MEICKTKLPEAWRGVRQSIIGIGVKLAFQADAEVRIGAAGKALPPLAETRMLGSLMFEDCKYLTVLDLNAPGMLEQHCGARDARGHDGG